MSKIFLILFVSSLFAGKSIDDFESEGWEWDDKPLYEEVVKYLNPYLSEMNSLLNPDKFGITLGNKVVDSTTVRLEDFGDINGDGDINFSDIQQLASQESGIIIDCQTNFHKFSVHRALSLFHDMAA